MARVTVEDCIDKVETRFELVMAAAKRARQIAAGAEPTVERNNDKNPVIALREIAEGTVDVKDLQDSIVTQYRRIVPHEEDEDELEIVLDEQHEEWEEIATNIATEAALIEEQERLEQEAKQQAQS